MKNRPQPMAHPALPAKAADPSTVRGHARRGWWRAAAAAFAATAVLAGCGFQLRGSTQIPFASMYLGVGESSGLGNELRRNLRSASNTTVVDDPKQAQARFELMSENREKEVLSINSAGRAREYTLRYTIKYRVHDGKGHDFIEPSTLTLKRDVSFNEDATLAKEAEEGLLFRDMQSDMVQQILRRLSLIRPDMPAQ